MLLLALALAAPPTEPTVPGAALPVEAQWSVIEACPKVELPGAEGQSATGVVIGSKDGFGYLLTAAHAVPVPYDRVELWFTGRDRYPKPVWYSAAAEVVGRWPDPDVALVRFPIKKHAVPVVPLAPPGQRSKTFPTPDVFTVGIARNGAATVQANTIQAKEFVRRPKREPAFFWRVEYPSEPGRSGGPLLDRDGRVIGIAAANRGDRGYFAHLDEIQAALKRDGFGWLVPTRP